jgi:hypothetical protein
LRGDTDEVVRQPKAPSLAFQAAQSQAASAERLPVMEGVHGLDSAKGETHGTAQAQEQQAA